MPVFSGGQVKNMATGLTSADGFAYDGPGLHPLARSLHNAHAYDAIYERQLWPHVAVSTLVDLQILLPGKTYRRRRAGREDARNSPFGTLMARPSTSLNPVQFWGWFALSHHVHGKAFAGKVRDRLGRPVELVTIHPTRMRYGPEGGGAAGIGPLGTEQGGNRWWLSVANGVEVELARSEFLYWPKPHPRHPQLGLSPMEPLRDTLENEAGARAANAAMWRSGGKHSVVLSYPRDFGSNIAVAKRIAEQYQARHGGVEEWGLPLVLDDGMEVKQLTMTGEELQYIEARKLNREEVAAAYKIPPPAIGILDRATFSNIVEQNRSLYRQTMAPTLQSFEAMIEFDLRDGRFGELDRPPDFGDAFYFEWLVDGVLRGNFEQRVTSYAQAIQTGQMTIAEVRELENRPFIEGTDVPFVNGAVVPVEVAAAADNTGAVVGPDGNTGGAPGLQPIKSAGPASVVMGRLSRQTSLDEVDVERLVEGLDVLTANAVRGAVDIARFGGLGVAELRQIVKGIGL